MRSSISQSVCPAWTKHFWRALKVDLQRFHSRTLKAWLLAGVAPAVLSNAPSRAVAAEMSTHRVPSFVGEQNDFGALVAAVRPPLTSTVIGYGGAGVAQTSSPSINRTSFETAEYRNSWFLGKINAADAYALGFTGRGVLVAVVDSGLDVGHPEFAGRVSPLLQSFLTSATGEPSNSVPDRKVTKTGELGAIAGHGTHVSGIIGAARDGLVMHGVAYNASILPLRALLVLESEEDDDDDDLDVSDGDPTNLALHYAVETRDAAGKRVGVLNGSYGPPAFPEKEVNGEKNEHYERMNYTLVIGGKGLDDEHRALKSAARADIVLVFAAGNTQEDQPIVSKHPIGASFYPYIRPQNHQNGVYKILDPADVRDFNPNNPDTYKTLDPTDPRVAQLDMSDLEGALIAVVATGPDNEIASYSNRCGVAFLWCLAAPGGNDRDDNNERKQIHSTFPEKRYEYSEGTSMAAPVVAGGAAVIREAFPYMTARQVIEIILTTTDNIGPREIYGRGLFNLGRAVRGPREFGAEGFAQIFDVNTKGYNSVWSNDIVGTGGLTKRGDGNLVLSGTNRYAGGTLVLGGELTLLGSVNSQLTVGTAATLRGIGRIDAPLRVFGSLDPGGARGSFGTLTVSGNVAFAQSSTYRVDANSQGDHDRLVVGGAATLAGGALEIALVNGLAPVETAIEILTATRARTGVFGSLRTNSVSAFLDPHLRYAGNSVTVSFDRNDVSFASAETNTSNIDVADAVQRLGGSSRLDDAIMRLDKASADRAFDLLAGEAHVGAAAVAYNDARLVRDAILTRLRMTADELPLGASPPNAFASYQPPVGAEMAAPPRLDQRRFTLWGEGFGSWGSIDANRSTAALNSSTGGFILGAEASAISDYRIGMAGGLTRTEFDLDGRLSSGSNETVFAAVYGSAGWGSLAVRLGTSYGWHDIDASRDVAFAGFTDRTGTSYRGSTLQGFGEVGYSFELARLQIEPIVGGSVLRLRTDGFAENGGPAALLGYERTYELGTTTVGVRTEVRLTDGAPLTLKGLLGWRHAYGDVEPEALLAFRDGAQAFTVAGVPVDRDAMIAEVGLDWQVTKDISVGASYTGQVGQAAQDHALKGNLTWRF